MARRGPLENRGKNHKSEPKEEGSKKKGAGGKGPSHEKRSFERGMSGRGKKIVAWIRNSCSVFRAKSGQRAKGREKKRESLY